MIKYRPKWCPACKYFLPGTGASSPKCLNKREVFIGESAIKCYAYTEAIINEMPMIRTTKSIVAEAIAARDKEWVEWAQSDCPHVSSAAKGRCPDCWQNRKEEITK